MRWLAAAGLVGAAALGLVESLARAEPGLLPTPVQEMTGRARAASGPVAAEFYTAWHAVHIPDPLLGFRCRPNLDLLLRGHPQFSYRLRTNSRGLRTRHEAGPLDAVVVGDSFSFGYGVSDEVAWPQQLARLGGRRIANLGVSGFGPDNELAMLRTEGLRLWPRLVLWQFFANDFLDAASYARWQEAGEQDFLAWERALHGIGPGQDTSPASSPAPDARRSLRGLLHRHLVSYELVKHGLRLGVFSRDHRPGRWIDASGSALWLDVADPLRWADPASAAVQVGQARTGAALLVAQEAARQNGAVFAVVIAPAREEVYWQGSAAERDLLARNGRWVVQFCQRHGIPCLNLADAFRQAAQRGSLLYFTQDLHWNPAGHRLAAQETHRWLNGLAL